MRAARILTVESHGPLSLLLRETLRDSLGAEPGGQVESVKGLLETLRPEEPQVIILDLSLPDQSALDAIPSVLQRAPRARIVALIEQDDSRYRKAATTRGASACVCKGRIATDLIPAICRAIGGCRECADSLRPWTPGPANE